MFSANAQPRFASVVVDGVLVPPRLARHTLRCPCISVVPEATDEASRGSETETSELLGGKEENSVSLKGPPGKSMIFYKKETEKN